MTSPSYAAFIGVDWAHGSHAVVVQDSNGRVEQEAISSDPSSIDQWLQRLQQRFKGQQVALCVEMSRGALVYQLADSSFVDIFPLNPVTSALFRKAFKPSGAKDDFSDARRHLSILLNHRDRLKLWSESKPEDERLRLLCECRRKLVESEVELCNRLRSALRDYYPQAVELAGTDLASPMACAFLCKWSDLESLKRAQPATVRKFYYAQGSRRGDVIERRLKVIEEAHPVTTERAIIEPMALYVVSLAKELQTLRRNIDQFETQIQQTFGEHEDAALWASFPGAGKVLAPRLAIAWGGDREQFDAAAEMQTYSGTAPVRSASGDCKKVFRRYLRPRFLHQTFWEYAKHSVHYSDWAKAYVEDQVMRGKKRSAAYRSLAFKWQRIMFTCWKNRTPYDEARYKKALEESGSPHHRKPKSAAA